MITLFRRRIFILASVMTATAAIAGCSPLQNLSSPATPAATHSTASGTPTGTHSPGRDRTASQSPTSAAADPTTPSQGSTATQTADPTQGATQTADPTQGATQTADPTQGDESDRQRDSDRQPDHGPHPDRYRLCHQRTDGPLSVRPVRENHRGQHGPVRRPERVEPDPGMAADPARY